MCHSLSNAQYHKPLRFNMHKTNYTTHLSANNAQFLIPQDAPKPPCSLEMKDGPGRALHPRWYFNTSTAECHPFFYGGMLGNANNFESLKECQGNCSGTYTATLVKFVSCF
ncbi:serine protease inhibitor, putative [Ixodes scapularis]|uniref:Serine protease inhibitor, putative n=1 Tax=Ixodes scapularis TaxID=6945 RepID=B7Q9P1_IXOSC|nr:serine protease inhibitor, putative [Ixodes scapularis]|eukprot:XP_002412528.1 serine protease inhibitor, putative [Ixodes scapularis]